MRLNIKNKLREPGILSNFANTAYGGKMHNSQKLSTSQMLQISKIFRDILDESGIRAPDIGPQLYDYLLADKTKVISSKDIVAFLTLTYILGPTQYWVPENKGPAYRDTIVGPGVPLALLGGKELGIIYEDWFPSSTDDPETVFYTDIFLGKSLSSTKADLDLGFVDFTPKAGLIKAREVMSYEDEEGNVLPYPMGASDILDIQRKKKSVSDYRAAELPGVPFPYNDLSQNMRHLVAQTWCWYYKHRSDNMITYIHDWDQKIKAANTATSIAPSKNVNKLLPGLDTLSKPRESSKPRDFVDYPDLRV